MRSHGSLRALNVNARFMKRWRRPGGQIRETAAQVRVMPKLRGDDADEPHFDHRALRAAHRAEDAAPMLDRVRVEVAGLLERFRTEQLIDKRRQRRRVEAIE